MKNPRMLILGLGVLSGAILGSTLTRIEMIRTCRPGPSTMVDEQKYTVYGVFDNQIDLERDGKQSPNKTNYWIPCAEGPCKNLKPGDKVMLAAVTYEDLGDIR